MVGCSNHAHEIIAPGLLLLELPGFILGEDFAFLQHYENHGSSFQLTTGLITHGL